MELPDWGVRGGLLLHPEPVEFWAREAIWKPSPFPLIKKQKQTSVGAQQDLDKGSCLRNCLSDVHSYQESFDGKKVIVSIFILLIYFPWLSNPKSFPYYSPNVLFVSFIALSRVYGLLLIEIGCLSSHIVLWAPWNQEPCLFCSRVFLFKYEAKYSRSWLNVVDRWLEVKWRNETSCTTG